MSQPQTTQPAAVPVDWKKCRVSKTGNILTPKCRITWPHLMIPQDNKLNPGAGKSYSLGILIPPGCDISLLKEDAKKAAIAKFGNNIPQNLRLPFQDPIAKKLTDFAGWTYIVASTKESRGRPSCANSNGQAIEATPEEAYGGRWACVSVKAWAYDKAGNRGVSFGLQSVQLLDHDEPIAGGGRINAEEEFAAVESSSGGAASSSNDIFA